MTGEGCVFGESGSSVSNHDEKGHLHGAFDVWVTQQDELLISDIGWSFDEPKQNLALGINRLLAEEIAHQRSSQTGMKILNTQRRCLACENPFWISEHGNLGGLTDKRRTNLCPSCIGKGDDRSLQKKLDSSGYWCG